MCVATIHRLNYGGQKSVKKKKKSIRVYDSDTPVTLNQGQGQQTWYELVDPKQV